MTIAIDKIIHKIRISAGDAHYAGDLVDGTKLLQFFGDVATEILVRHDGDEGLFRAYESIEFLAPVYSGDFLEIEGTLLQTGNTSRKIQFEARKVITLLKPAESGYLAPSSAKVLKPSIIVCKAIGTCVTPKNLQHTLKKPPRDLEKIK